MESSETLCQLVCRLPAKPDQLKNFVMCKALKREESQFQYGSEETGRGLAVLTMTARNDLSAQHVGTDPRDSELNEALYVTCRKGRCYGDGTKLEPMEIFYLLRQVSQGI